MTAILPSRMEVVIVLRSLACQIILLSMSCLSLVDSNQYIAYRMVNHAVTIMCVYGAE